MVVGQVERFGKCVLSFPVVTTRWCLPRAGANCGPGYVRDKLLSLVSIRVHQRLTVHIELSCVTGGNCSYAGQVHRRTGILTEGFLLGLS